MGQGAAAVSVPACPALLSGTCSSGVKVWALELLSFSDRDLVDQPGKEVL